MSRRHPARPCHLVGAHPGATGLPGNAGRAQVRSYASHPEPRMSSSIPMAERDDGPAHPSALVGAHPGATSLPGNAPVAPGGAPTQAIGRHA
ncbi:hypothetical protein LMG31884_06600 [Xanthomonas hydrangeae]|nr:hypothetical protein LMG31884_06600 [Xanthomonas hydrangeae]CAD7713542.1 hypothetical protein LMG31884_06600 [Xanthomonas hydrangeae]CAD7720189.1 hypothetical protein LMG31887_06600 [Xanthomonas hydrangeae]CAD7720193.1 hypothetical protein LMG31887_06600 [Xanthomonas hydrangeae]